MSIIDNRKVGDKVSVDHPKYPGVWTIIRRGPVNSVLRQEGNPRSLRCPHTMLTDPGAAPTPTVTTFPATLYHPGELIRVTGKYAGLYVVIKDGGTDKVNLAKLGGDGGRYLRTVRHGLERVDVAKVLRNDYQEL